MGNSFSNTMCEECGNVEFHNSQYNPKDRLCLSCPRTICCEDGWFAHLELNSNINNVLNGNDEFFEIADNAFKENYEEQCYEDIISFCDFLSKNQKFILNQNKYKIVELFGAFQIALDTSIDKIKMLNDNLLITEIKEALGDTIY